MEFLCIQEADGPSGQHWFAGDVYTMTRRDLYQLREAEFDIAGTFEPANEAAQPLFDEFTQE